MSHDDLDNYWGIFATDSCSGSVGCGVAAVTIADFSIDAAEPCSGSLGRELAAEAVAMTLADVIIDLDSSQDVDAVSAIPPQPKARWHFAGAYRQMVRTNRRVRSLQVLAQVAAEAVWILRCRMQSRAAALMDVCRHLATCNEELLDIMVALASCGDRVDMAAFIAEHNRMQRRVRLHAAYIRAKVVGRARHLQIVAL